MVAASFWSLLSPAIESAEKSGYYGKYAFGPVAIGFALGGIFVMVSDKFIPHCVSKFFFFFFFFCLGVLSRPFMNHRTAGEWGGYFFNSSLPLPPASETLRP